MPTVIRPLEVEELHQQLPSLSEILVETVQAGASVGFILPFTTEAADRFWQQKVFPAVEQNKNRLLGAFLDEVLLGTVQLGLDLPPNQPHRADVAKLLVHPMARRAGLGQALMLALEAQARSLGKTLLLLDTRSGDPSQRLYEKLGYLVAGSVPGFCRHPATETYESTTYLYKQLG